MSRPVVWVHGDDLSPTNAALLKHPEAPALFVFDQPLLDHYQISLKRLVFLYECLLELPVTIRRGRISEEILEFARENRADSVVTTRSVSPRFFKIVGKLEAEIGPVTILEPPRFAADLDYDLKRFSRYWKKAEASVCQAPEQLKLLP